MATCRGILNILEHRHGMANKQLVLSCTSPSLQPFGIENIKRNTPETFYKFIDFSFFAPHSFHTGRCRMYARS
jgi:hypothetical protein